jgi:hypothetical protein
VIRLASGPWAVRTVARSFMIAWMDAAAVGRSNAPNPSTAKNSVAPNAHRSEAGEASWPSRRSGEMYVGEPISVPLVVNRVSSVD